ncbi:hypothetical protein CRG98_005151 [Punica granatum]|uniref:Uncharacterized protein n=1 Tax=Punica granatum TaxID=22663 RepID=A0A2I0L178_PUNGR|nr:hypothetical protein CRG98_005151 [Punica granatum]
MQSPHGTLMRRVQSRRARRTNDRAARASSGKSRYAHAWLTEALGGLVSRPPRTGSTCTVKDHRYREQARTTADSEFRPFGIHRRSTPELESFSTRHPAKQNPSLHSRGIANESTIAQQQTRHPTKCNRSKILGATSAPLHYSRVSQPLHRSQGFIPISLHLGFTPTSLQPQSKKSLKDSTRCTQLHHKQMTNNKACCHSIVCNTNRLSDG